MQSYWFSKQSKINIIYNISVITITITMSIILANFGKYAISDCPFIRLLICISRIMKHGMDIHYSLSCKCFLYYSVLFFSFYFIWYIHILTWYISFHTILIGCDFPPMLSNKEMKISSDIPIFIWISYRFSGRKVCFPCVGLDQVGKLSPNTPWS